MQKLKARCCGSKDSRVTVNGTKKSEIKRWEKPTLEDVSEKIMAQPYIRFT